MVIFFKCHVYCMVLNLRRFKRRKKEKKGSGKTREKDIEEVEEIVEKGDVKEEELVET